MPLQDWFALTVGVPKGIPNGGSVLMRGVSSAPAARQSWLECWQSNSPIRHVRGKKSVTRERAIDQSDFARFVLTPGVPLGGLNI